MPRAKPTIYQRNARTRVNSVRRIEQAKTAGAAQRHVDATTARSIQEGVHERHRVTTESELGGVRRRQQLTNRAGDAAISTATPNSDSGLVMTTLFVMFGLIIIYILVTNPGPTSGWLGGVGNAIHALSSNKPLFTATAKGT